MQRNDNKTRNLCSPPPLSGRIAGLNYFLVCPHMNVHNSVSQLLAITTSCPWQLLAMTDDCPWQLLEVTDDCPWQLLAMTDDCRRQLLAMTDDCPWH